MRYTHDNISRIYKYDSIDKIPRNILTIMTKKPPIIQTKNDYEQSRTYRNISRKLNFPS